MRHGDNGTHHVEFIDFTVSLRPFVARANGVWAVGHVSHLGSSSEKMAHDSLAISSFVAATRKAVPSECAALRWGYSDGPASELKGWRIFPIGVLHDVK